MAGAKAEAAGLSGVLRITWVADDLAHVLEHSQTDETRGTWTGLACGRSYGWEPAAGDP
jgi:hypothetical protein